MPNVIFIEFDFLILKSGAKLWFCALCAMHLVQAPEEKL